MAQYTLLPDGAVRRQVDDAYIPADPRNVDYAAYLAWVAAGNTPDLPPVIPPAVPSPITRRQFILALLGAGLISGDDALAAATSGALPAPFAALLETMPAADALAARITWASMAVAERGSPLIAMMVAAGAATDAQVDDLFRVGATL